MSIRAQSADGVIHEFPEGTPDSVVDGAMKKYADADVTNKSSGAFPSSSDMRSLASPGYAAARRDIKATDDFAKGAMAKVPGASALGNFESQVVRNLGVSDEVSGGLNFLRQGAQNLISRVQGKPITTTAGQAGQAAMDYDREQRQSFAGDHPVQNALATGVGIMTAGAPVRGATAALSPLQAGGAAAATNAPFALGRQEGSLKERLPGAAAETAMAFGMGSALQAGGNALAGRAAAARARPPTDARVLSQAGTDLTPGQMAGGLGKRVEDALTSVPGVGDAIRARQTDSLRSFNRTVVDRALAPIGQNLPAGVTGREAIVDAGNRISAAYDAALAPVTVAPDAQFTTELNNIINSVSPRVRGDVTDLVDDVVRGQMGGQITGQQWKAIDEELGSAISSAQAGEATAPINRVTRRALQQVQAAHRSLLDRIDPAASQAVGAADDAFANMVRINKAAQSTTTAKTDGLFTPNQFNTAVAQGSKRAYGRGEALMQDLSDPAARVLPSSVPDSGTALRSIMAAGGIGGSVAGANAMGAGAVAAPAAAVALGANALAMGAYSRPVIRLLNAIYRSSTPGQATEALGQLAQLAARDPALAPVYREAAQRLGVPLPEVAGRRNALAHQPEAMTR